MNTGSGFRALLSSALNYFQLYAKKARPVDYAVIIGLLLFCSFIVIALFPKVAADGEDYYFVNVLMTVPIIIALYLIFTSFKRRAKKDFPQSTGIRTKIALVFMFVAILPSLPVIIVTNSLVNRSIGNLISGDTRKALDHSIVIAGDRISSLADEITAEMRSVKLGVERKMIDTESESGRYFIAESAGNKGLIFMMFNVKRKSQWGNLLERLPSDSGEVKFSQDVSDFLRISDFRQGIDLSRISSADQELLVVTYYSYPFLYAFFRVIPENLNVEMDYLVRARSAHNEKEELLPAIRSGLGIALLILSLIIIVVSAAASLFLAKNITKPVFELTDTAGKIAKGNFDIHLERKSKDELSLLFNSFNQMASELKETREKTVEIEKLKVWNQISRRLIHEIRNPLTPIRLSAERMRRRIIEKKDDIERTVLSAAETIIEEVDSLQHIMQEFTDYARLPEVKIARNNVNDLIISCVKFYEGHENVHFALELDSSIPDFSFDRHLMRQALINMIKNSIEAMDNSGTIVIATGLFDANVKIFFKDTGSGIDEKLISNIFEPTFTRKIGGSGLGLAIVKKIIFEHGGKIECRSPLNEGAEFEITLPFRVENG